MFYVAAFQVTLLENLGMNLHSRSQIENVGYFKADVENS